MSIEALTTKNAQDLHVDTTNIALMAIHERLVELERQYCLETDDALKVSIATEHRKLLDFYQSEIQRAEDYNPYSTPYDW
ncbi:hypothetical protein [Vibrio splendidus]|uniref:Uncharacterized protein n=1 Tax=Vibrio splendidus 12E03 TaxID=1191305 RepID=A0A1E5FUW1_VIBSP|nr:hypothetical protein [Vibrio splendidus]OEF94174.1 hypothetical protein A142_18050 [Vibrio splendidus 12E03]